MESLDRYSKGEGEPLKPLEEIASDLASHDEELRRLAVVALGPRPLSESEELVFRALGDESWRVRKEAVTILLAEGGTPEIVEGLIALLRCRDNAGMRNAAVESLVGLGPVAVPPLCRHLDDFDHDLRKFIIDILGSIGSADCVPQLLRAMEDPDPNVRSGAVENLGKLRDPRAIPHLLQALSVGDVWFRFAILDALAAIGSPVPLEAITPLLEENLLRRAIYDCLGAVGELDCLPILVDGVQERARSARDSAAVALMRLRTRMDEAGRQRVDKVLKGFKGTHLLDGILRSVGCADLPVLEPLVGLLGIVGDPRSALALLALSRHERLRYACAQAFRSLGTGVLPALWEYFPIASPDERAFIAYLSGELGFHQGGGLLLEVLKDDSPQLRSAALLSLGKLNVPGAPKKIARCLSDREPGVRSSALEALDRLAAMTPATIAPIAHELAVAQYPERRRDAARILGALKDGERLSLMAKDEVAAVRKAAVASLSRLEEPQVVKHLVLALVDEAPEVRMAAAGALGKVGGGPALAPLLLALGDPDEGVQIAALKGLAELKAPESLSGVLAYLAGRRGAVLIAGLRTVAAVGGSAALQPVREALSDPDEEIVEAAIAILSRYDGEWIAQFQEKLLSHPHWGVRSSFARVIGAKLGVLALPHLKAARDRERDPLVRGEIEAVMGRLS